MSNFEQDNSQQENNSFQNEQQTAAQPQQYYNGEGGGRKESPFANSPYENACRPQPDQSDFRGYVPPRTPPVQPPREKKHHRSIWRPVAASLMAVALAAGSCGLTAWMVNNHWTEKNSQLRAEFQTKLESLQSQIDSASGFNTGNSVSGSPMAIAGGLTPGQVYARNVQSVVAISNQGTTMNLFGQISETASSGSGFILTADGYVVTNYHVIEGASRLTVITYEGTEYDAKVVGFDNTNDLALLKVDAENLPAVTIGSSDELIVGDMVVAIGNPLGELTSTQTVGYISAKERDVMTDSSTINMMQTDCAINPGNSGGPLFNMKGEVVGITTAKYSGSTTSGASIEGIGFAIPIDDVIGMIESLQQHGYVTGAYLGIMVRSLDPSVAGMYGLPMGSYVESVNEGSCSEKAGLQSKDIITGLGEYPVENNTDLTRALRKYNAGDTIAMQIFRGGQEMTLTITLDERPRESTSPQPQQPAEGQMPENGSYDEWYNYFAPFFGRG